MFATIVDYIFGFALFLNVLSFLPQAWRIYKERDAKEISLLTFGCFLFIQITSVAYGFIHHDNILLIGYALSFLTCGAVFVLAVFFR